MKICYVHEEYPEETNFGGIATYQKAVAEEMARQGHSVIVVARGLECDKDYVENGVRVIRIFDKPTSNQIKNYESFRKKVAKKLLELQNQNLIDIIETPDWGAYCTFFEKDRLVPMVVRFHTPLKIWLEYNKNNYGPVKDKLLKWEEEQIDNADYLTCCSKILKDMVVRDFKVQRTKILVCPNPANVTKFYREPKIEKINKLIFVGSLEERKGATVLAKALNIVFESYPNFSIDFIGNDTTRNSQNISTVRLIRSLVNTEHQDKLNFLGQIPNEDINYYLNRSMVGIYPSLFDNFPYVCLEGMAVGLHVVGSKNSGMVEMLEDPDSIYDTGDFNDLAFKIIKKIKLAQRESVNKKNIDRVKTEYNPEKVCSDLIGVYTYVVKEYMKKYTSKFEIEYAVKGLKLGKLKSFTPEKRSVSNYMFNVITDKRDVELKKYLYDYDFELARHLYDIYEENKIDVIRPINKAVYNNGYLNYAAFKYIKKEKLKLDMDLLCKLVLCNRKIKEEKITSKLSKQIFDYYNYLTTFKPKVLDSKDVNYVTDVYDKVEKQIKHMDDSYINHGDLSESNMIASKGKTYIIDFDETCVTYELYDFAAICVKNFADKNGNFDTKLISELAEKIRKAKPQYSVNDLNNMIIFYLCKYLLEKCYIYETEEGNKSGKDNKHDEIEKYLKMLKEANENGLIRE